VQVILNVKKIIFYQTRAGIDFQLNVCVCSRVCMLTVKNQPQRTTGRALRPGIKKAPSTEGAEV
jgi:hypothetical protein